MLTNHVRHSSPLLSVASAVEVLGGYDLTRPRAGIGGLSPWTRVNNLLGNDS